MKKSPSPDSPPSEESLPTEDSQSTEESCPLRAHPLRRAWPLRRARPLGDCPLEPIYCTGHWACRALTPKESEMLSAILLGLDTSSGCAGGCKPFCEDRPSSSPEESCQHQQAQPEDEKQWWEEHSNSGRTECPEEKLPRTFFPGVAGKKHPHLNHSHKGSQTAATSSTRQVKRGFSGVSGTSKASSHVPGRVQAGSTFNQRPIGGQEGCSLRCGEPLVPPYTEQQQYTPKRAGAM